MLLMCFIEKCSCIYTALHWVVVWIQQFYSVSVIKYLSSVFWLLTCKWFLPCRGPFIENAISMATTSKSDMKHKAVASSSKVEYYKHSLCYLNFLLKKKNLKTLHVFVNSKYKTQYSDCKRRGENGQTELVSVEWFRQERVLRLPVVLVKWVLFCVQESFKSAKKVGLSKWRVNLKMRHFKQNLHRIIF